MRNADITTRLKSFWSTGQHPWLTRTPSAGVLGHTGPPTGCKVFRTGTIARSGRVDALVAADSPHLLLSATTNTAAVTGRANIDTLAATGPEVASVPLPVLPTLCAT